MDTNQFHFTLATDKKVDEVIANLEKALKEVSFGVLWSFEVHKKLEEKGLSTNNKITILEVCNPQEAAGILEIDPLASYFLPCKMIVTEENSKTKVGLLSPKVLLGFIENKKLNNLADEIENKLIETIKRAV